MSVLLSVEMNRFEGAAFYSDELFHVGMLPSVKMNGFKYDALFK